MQSPNRALHPTAQRLRCWVPLRRLYWPHACTTIRSRDEKGADVYKVEVAAAQPTLPLKKVLLQLERRQEATQKDCQEFF
jgi:hypothetical protein